MEWIDGNLGSKLTMKYPAVYLMGPEAHGEILSIAFAGKGQHQDAGGKVVHVAPYTSSKIVSKSICKDGGRATYRGLLKVAKGATESKQRRLRCAAAGRARPLGHLSLHRDRRGQRQRRPRGVGLEDRRGAAFYLMSRGLSEDEAAAMIVRGFIEPFTRNCRWSMQSS